MRHFAVCAVTLAAAALAAIAGATIVSTSGDAVRIPPPPSVELGALESDTFMFVFDEQQCVRTSRDLPVNITAAGTYDDTGDLTPGTIQAGTLVSSHFIHVDSASGGPGQPVFFEGGITVDADILGVAIKGPALNATDVLGSPGTSYPKRRRSLNLDNQDDFLTVSGDLRTVRVHAENHGHADQVRVITKCGQQRPEGCTPGYWKQDQHLDSWVGYSPNDSYNVVFNVTQFPGKTLLGVLKLEGDSVNSLGRHSVAALLNAAHPDVDYPLTEMQVKTMTKLAFDSGDPDLIESTKRTFQTFNESGCPLNDH